jgi:carbonic anhydrase
MQRLFRNNAQWQARKTSQDPEFFTRLAKQQSPDYLWIGCADSRVPANDIVDLDPGEVFVHRNVANVVVLSDMNLLAVLQYAVDALRVREIVVAGHYGCGGVKAALGRSGLSFVDTWLRPIHETYAANRAELEALADGDTCVNRLCELHVRQQVHNVAATTIVQDAWARGQTLGVNGVIYDHGDGKLRDLGCRLTSRRDADAQTVSA